MDWKQAGRRDQKNDPAFWDRGGRKGGLEGQCLCMGVLVLQMHLNLAVRAWCMNASVCICIDL